MSDEATGRDAGDPAPSAGSRPRFRDYRELMAHYGFRPSRRLGQNFLLDPSLHRVIADAVQPGPADLALEVGPGLGFLTRELAARCRVLAVEIDERLVRILRGELPSFPGGGASVRLLHADALAGSRLDDSVVAALEEERAAATGRFLVVANLPYAVAAPLVAELAALPVPPDEMALLVQAEMARRLAAAPGTREYGALSVQLQLGYEVRPLRRVAAQVFRPRPRVDSAIVHLRRLPGGGAALSAAERRDLAGFLRRVFAGRRKKLRNSKALQGRDVPAGLLGRLEERPDAIRPADFLALWRAVR